MSSDLCIMLSKSRFIKMSYISVGILLLLVQSAVADVISTQGFPKGFLNEITESNIVRGRLASRWKWEVWDIVPGHHFFRLYVFNVTNPTEVEEGNKPILSEVGPYVYTEQRAKFNESMNLDFTVNYERTFTYTFDPAKSNGTEDDLVNVINFPFIIFSTIASRRGNPGSEAVNKLVRDGEQLIKRKVKIGDVLFKGIDVTKYTRYVDMLDDGHDSLLKEEFSSGRYGVFKMKIGTNEGNFTVESGLKDTTNFGRIKKWRNANSLNFWYGDTCNAINGTDGSVFPPNVGKSSKLEMFDIDLCRSIDFLYEDSSSFHSVSAMKFALDKDLLADPRTDPSKLCFCKNPEPGAKNCLKRGVLDVSSCRDGAPYVMSYPHFLDANPEYGQSFGGLQPDPKLHSTNIEVQPRIGVITKYSRRLQWNIRLQPLPNVAQFAKARSLIFPIAWNDDAFALDADKVDLLVSELANQDAYGGKSNLKSFFPMTVISGLSVFLILS